MRQICLASYAKSKWLILFIFINQLIFSVHSDLDTNFGNYGSVLVSLNSSNQWNQISLQSDQKIVAAGITNFNSNNNGLLARYNTNGTLDVNFGTNGLVTTSIGTSDTINTVAIQSDGKIIIGGFTFTNNSQYMLIRYTNNGLLDTSFNGTGIITSLIGDGCAISSIIIQPDNYIVVVGTTILNGVPYAFLARYDASGNLDTANFGVNGVAILTNSYASAVSVGLQANGSIIVGGCITPGTQSFIARFTSSGVLDTSFGSSGIVFNSSNAALITNLSIDSDDSIVVAGTWQINSVNNAYLQRYNNDGSLNTSFGNAGIVLLTYGGWQYNIFNSVVIQSDEKIVAAGGAGIYTLVARYNSDGTLDASFGTSGILTDSIGSQDQLRSVLIQSNGKIVAGGNTDSSALLMRYYANNTPFVSIQQPLTGSVLASRTTIISGISSELDERVDITVNGNLFNSVSTDSHGNWSAGTSQFLINSSGSITAQVISNNTVIASDTSNFTISASDQIVINNPVNNSTIATITPAINGYSSRAGAQVHITIDGLLFNSVTTDSQGNWDAGDSYGLNNGMHTLTADLIVSGITIATTTESFRVNALIGPTGPRGNTGADITAKNYLFAYDTTAQTVSTLR